MEKEDEKNKKSITKPKTDVTKNEQLKSLSDTHQSEQNNELQNEDLALASESTNIEDKDCETESIISNDAPILSENFFFTEVMSTAGPRKNFQENAREGDVGLGEDVVGCFVRKNIAYFWLLDGTSDCPIFMTSDYKEIISSRLLSQDVAWNLQKIIWDNNSITNSEEVLKVATTNLKFDWQNKLDELSEEDRNRLINYITEKTQILISTTVIFGKLDIDGSLDVSRIGDSYIITNPANDEPDVKGRLFIIIKFSNDENKFIVESNSHEDTRCQYFKKEKINTILLASDGLSLVTKNWLHGKPQNFTDPIFRKTLSAIKHGTCDDKALCIIQILANV